MRCGRTFAVTVLALFAGGAICLGAAAPTGPAGAGQAGTQKPLLPVRGLHVLGASHAEVDLYEKFIREALASEGVNVLVWEIGYDYAFTSYPRVANSEGVTAADVARIAKACKESGVELVPQINCLGHQSWHENRGALLRAFPDFDETPSLSDNSKDLYCRSYCPLHPDLHKVLFALMDEVADAAQVANVHCGMDEVFLIADQNCPRCGGKGAADLFAGEVKALHDHLAARGATMWMWGDRFIDGRATRLGSYEASANGTSSAVDAVPKDIIICDWHYRRAARTPEFFLDKGFRVVACPWKDERVALDQLQMMNALHTSNDRALGMLQTTWVGFGGFVRAYYGQSESADAAGAASCFRALFAAMRNSAGQTAR